MTMTMQGREDAVDDPVPSTIPRLQRNEEDAMRAT